MIADPFLDVLDEDEYGEMVAWELTNNVDWQPDTASFNPAYLPYLDNMARTQIYFGGSSSGKSVFLAQRAAIDLLLNKRNYLVCRAVSNSLADSTYLEVKTAIEEMGIDHRFKFVDYRLRIDCDTGYRMIFKGLDKVEKLKSIRVPKGAITDIWIEEATESEESDIKQLVRRQRGGDLSVPKRLTLSFNPIFKAHWIYKSYFTAVQWETDQAKYHSNDLTILKTTYKNNQFLGQDEIDLLENEPDEYWRDVYTLGNWGVLGDVVFKNWEVRDLSSMHNQFTNHRHGLDFGFNEPAALVVTHYDRQRKAIYIYDELYKSELTNDVLAAQIEPIIGGNYVVCDSAEPKSIKELGDHGIRAYGAEKGKDSIWHGIQWLKQQTIIIDKKCVNTVNEFQLYQWKKDKYGDAIDVPIDKHNHAIDALRYAYEQDMKAGMATHRQGKVKGRGGNGRRIKARVR